MLPPLCRLLPLSVADGPTQMASDEALLHSATEFGVASLRCYTWSEATLSLGYFQPHELRLTDAKRAALPFVRRATGGGAIVHHHEVTYGLALPPGLPWQTKESWTCRMHHSITAALETLGVQTHPVLCGEEKKLGEFLCFLHQTRGDLLIGSHKVVGSAQRKLRGAIVQHGSILLRQSPFAPELPGILELSGVALTAERVAEALVKELRSRTGWQIEAGKWTDTELQDTQQIRQEKYQTDDWNQRR